MLVVQTGLAGRASGEVCVCVSVSTLLLCCLQVCDPALTRNVVVFILSVVERFACPHDLGSHVVWGWLPLGGGGGVSHDRQVPGEGRD